jgi:serine/threonine-protein kinase RsbW
MRSTHARYPAGYMVHLCVPSTLRCRGLIIAAIRAGCDVAAERLGRQVSERFVDELITAGGEAFNNLVLHGYGGDPDGQVELHVAITDKGDGIRLRFRDAGAAFRPDAVPLPDLDALPERGMGMFLIRSLVDVVRYRSGDHDMPGVANELVLEKRLLA